MRIFPFYTFPLSMTASVCGPVGAAAALLPLVSRGHSTQPARANFPQTGTPLISILANILQTRPSLILYPLTALSRSNCVHKETK